MIQLPLAPRDAARLLVKALGGVGSGIRGHVTERNERSRRALAAFKPANADVQRHAEENELYVRKLVGGQRTGDNSPVDVVTRIGDRVKGIEVKTLMSNSHDKITVRKGAMAKKLAWARSNRAALHTVVLDERGQGRQLYHAKGVGSFRLSSMTPVASTSQLKQLLSR